MDSSTAQCGALLAYSLKPFGHSLNFAGSEEAETIKKSRYAIASLQMEFYVFCSSDPGRPGQGHLTAN